MAHSIHEPDWEHELLSVAEEPTVIDAWASKGISHRGQECSWSDSANSSKHAAAAATPAAVVQHQRRVSEQPAAVASSHACTTSPASTAARRRLPRFNPVAVRTPAAGHQMDGMLSEAQPAQHADAHAAAMLPTHFASSSARQLSSDCKPPPESLAHNSCADVGQTNAVSANHTADQLYTADAVVARRTWPSQVRNYTAADCQVSLQRPTHTALHKEPPRPEAASQAFEALSLSDIGPAARVAGAHGTRTAPAMLRHVDLQQASMHSSAPAAPATPAASVCSTRCFDTRWGAQFESFAPDGQASKSAMPSAAHAHQPPQQPPQHLPLQQPRQQQQQRPQQQQQQQKWQRPQQPQQPQLRINTQPRSKVFGGTLSGAYSPPPPNQRGVDYWEQKYHEEQKLWGPSKNPIDIPDNDVERLRDACREKARTAAGFKDLARKYDVTQTKLKEFFDHGDWDHGSDSDDACSWS